MSALAGIVNWTQNVSTRRCNPPQTNIVHVENSRSVLLGVLKNAPELERHVLYRQTAIQLRLSSRIHPGTALGNFSPPLTAISIMSIMDRMLSVPSSGGLLG
jgi:hypothetical protein